MRSDMACDWVRLYGYTFRDQESALSMAAEHGQMEIVKWLCDTIGVDVEGAMHRALGVTCIGPSGLDPARNVEVARFLLERGAKTSFCSAEQPEGGEGEDGDGYYCDLINVAAQHGQHLVLLELLLRNYRETTDKSTADALNSALKEAVEEQDEMREPSYREAGRVKCAHLLLAFGADPRALTMGTTERAQAHSNPNIYLCAAKPSDPPWGGPGRVESSGLRQGHACSHVF